MTQERSLSVTEAMNLARSALESVRVSVVGEVSEFSDKPGYKAAYFTVSDAGAAMSCLMWRDAYEASGVALRAGMQVEVTGQFSAYVPKGRMQFVVRRLTQAGEGVLRMQVAEIARRLQTEGLMDAARKRSLPRFPQRIAVVTSPRGKAVHDVLRTLRRRYPLAEVLVAGVPVEGEKAPQALIAGLEAAEASAPDVILLVRGGGSYEDLMPFNDEALARAVRSCAVPVVTGIGHEPDNSIADMVADVRASTPTGAAEAATPAADELRTLLAREARALGRGLQVAVERASQRVMRLTERRALRAPRDTFGASAQQLDLARMRLERAIPDRIARDGQRLSSASSRMGMVGRTLLDRSRSSVAMSAARLDDLSPLRILARGFAVASRADTGAVLRTAGQVSVGQGIVVRIANGELDCTVDAIREDAR